MEEQIFEKLFREHYNLLCNYAGKFITDNQVTEDIVQNFFITVWEKKHLSLNTDVFLPYAYRAIKNSCINYYKHTVVQENFFVALQEEWQEHFVEEDDEFIYKHEVQQALQKLPEKCRRVFLLKCVSELKYKEIAAMLDISVNTVKYHLGEAFRVMKEELNHLFFFFFLFSI